MISAEVLARKEAQLKAQQPSGGGYEAIDDLSFYYETCALTIVAALELYRYEYGHLPASLDELVQQEYLDRWPGDPAEHWAPLRVGYYLESPTEETVMDPLPPFWIEKDKDGSYKVETDYDFFWEVPATWLETEAKMHGMDYRTYEEQLSAQYPDRALWPASGIVKPPVQAGSMPPAGTVAH